MDPFSIAQWVVRALLALMFVTAGVVHLVPRCTRLLAAWIPPRLTLREPLQPTRLVAVAGIVAIIGAALLLVPQTRIAGGALLAVWLVAVLPADLHRIRAAGDGRTGARIAGQVVLVAACLFSCI